MANVETKQTSLEDMALVELGALQDKLCKLSALLDGATLGLGRIEAELVGPMPAAGQPDHGADEPPSLPGLLNKLGVQFSQVGDRANITLDQANDILMRLARLHALLFAQEKKSSAVEPVASCPQHYGLLYTSSREMRER